MLRVTLLGTLQVSFEERPIAGINTPRLLAFLAFLLLHPGVAHTRQHLAFLLWPDSDEQQARTNLRNLLHLLRRALPEPEQFLQIDQTSVQWRADAPCVVDVARFEALLDHARPGNRAEHERRQKLEAALHLYQGELLPGVYDEWVVAQRERLHWRQIGALDDLISLLERLREYGAAIGYAQQRIRAEPLQEPAYLRLMELYAAQGDRAGALQAYHMAATTLGRELQVEPDVPLQQAYARLVQTPVEQTLSPPTPIPLVGRVTEWQHLQSAWQRTLAGQPQLFVLRGEAGVGKTHLLEALCAWVDRLGYASAMARCYAGAGELAYAPAALWLRSGVLRSARVRLAGVWQQEVARILPEIALEHPGLPTPTPLIERWQRQRFFEALTRAVLATDQPLLLVLDDIQWCDQDTLDWLGHLLRFDSHTPLLLACTLRDEEVDQAHALHGWLAALGQRIAVAEQTLAPLNEEETAALGAHVAGMPLDPQRAQRLYRESEGYPLFVIELLRAGWLERDNEQALGQQLPQSVQSLLAGRIRQLSPAASELVGLAATIGRAFSASVLQRASPLDDVTLIRALDELWQRRIIRDQDTDSYDFTHAKLRELAYAELSGIRRRFWHQRVAEALVALAAGQERSVAGQVAQHYERANQWEQALRYYEHAAATAHDIHANSEAITMLRRAVALLNIAPAQTRQPHMLRVYEQLGDMYTRVGSSEDARAAYLQAQAATDAHDAVRLAHLHRLIGVTWRNQQQLNEALAAYGQAEVCLQQASSEQNTEWWHEWVALQIDRIWVYFYSANLRELDALVQQVRMRVAQHGSTSQQVLFLSGLAALNLQRERYVPSAGTLHDFRQALDLHQVISAPHDAAIARLGLGHALLWAGNIAEAETHLQQSINEAELLGDALLRIRCQAFLAICARKRGDSSRTEALSNQLLADRSSEQYPHLLGIARANMAWVAWRQQRWQASGAHAEAALQLWHQAQRVPYMWLALWPLCALALQHGEFAAARAYAHQLLEPTQQQLPADLAAALQAALAYEQHVQEHLTQALILAQALHYM